MSPSSRERDHKPRGVHQCRTAVLVEEHTQGQGVQELTRLQVTNEVIQRRQLAVVPSLQHVSQSEHARMGMRGHSRCITTITTINTIKHHQHRFMASKSTRVGRRHPPPPPHIRKQAIQSKATVQMKSTTDDDPPWPSDVTSLEGARQ